MQMSVLAVLVFISVLGGGIRGCAGEICRGPVCEYHLTVRHARSMSYFSGGASYLVGINGSRLEVVPSLLRLAGNSPLIGKTLSPDDVITLDGLPATIIVINNQFPGPTIEVMEGTEVVVHVTNHMTMEGTSIHWHGMYQRGTPWMDGTAYVSQCLIQPRQTFTYRFTASPAGTHWYHSHIGVQRMDGLFGMFIVHKAEPQDWYPVSARDRLVSDPWSMEYQSTGEWHMDSSFREYSIDGVQLGAIGDYVALINGRGRRGDNQLPLTEYTVTKGDSFRFRCANVGAEYAWEISVDGHTMSVVAVDGHEIQPLEVDSVTIETGETLDFEVKADQDVGNYWIRVRNLRATTGWNPDHMDGKNVEGLAVLRYTGAGPEEPTTSLPDCIQRTKKCRVFNCNFGDFPDKYNKECVHFTAARSADSQAALQADYGIDDDDVEEIFLNFAFTAGSSVNARKFRMPSAPLYQEGALGNYTVSCDDAVCDEEGCTCTHILDLPLGKTVQIVMLNYAQIAIFAQHPIHYHGTGFAVLAQGHPEQDPDTGHWSRENQDVNCHNLRCSRASWRTRPTLNTERPVVKDTLVVPARGYAVVRFKATNPGYWFVHCHVEQHVTDGMNMVLNMAPGHHPPLPADFPRCYNYTGSPPQAVPPTTARPRDQAQDTGGQRGDHGHREEGDVTCAGNNEGELGLTVSQLAGIIIGSVIVGGLLAAVPVICLMCFRRDKYVT